LGLICLLCPKLVGGRIEDTGKQDQFQVHEEDTCCAGSVRKPSCHENGPHRMPNRAPRLDVEIVADVLSVYKVMNAAS